MELATLNFSLAAIQSAAEHGISPFLAGTMITLATLFLIPIVTDRGAQCDPSRRAPVVVSRRPIDKGSGRRGGSRRLPGAVEAEQQ